MRSMVEKLTRLSVIIPVYNVAPYLRACLDSVLAAVREVEKVGGGGQRWEKFSIFRLVDSSIDRLIGGFGDSRVEVERGRRSWSEELESGWINAILQLQLFSRNKFRFFDGDANWMIERMVR